MHMKVLQVVPWKSWGLSAPFDLAGLLCSDSALSKPGEHHDTKCTEKHGV